MIDSPNKSDVNAPKTDKPQAAPPTQPESKPAPVQPAAAPADPNHVKK